MKKATGPRYVTRENFNYTTFVMCGGILGSGGLIGSLWWRSTLSPGSGVAEKIAVFIMSISVVPLFFALGMLAGRIISSVRQRRAYKRAKEEAARAQAKMPPPEEFFATHQETLEAINQMLFADAEQKRALEEISYTWISSDRYVFAESFPAWSFELTEEQRQLFESLLCAGNVYITLTEHTVAYQLDNCKIFCVPEHSDTSANWLHLGGKWYYDVTPSMERESS
jgi:hypothetical protein